MLKRLACTHGQGMAKPHVCAFSEGGGEVTLTLLVLPSQRGWHLVLTGPLVVRETLAWDALGLLCSPFWFVAEHLDPLCHRPPFRQL